MYLWALHRGWTDGVLHHRASGHGRFPSISSSVMLFPWVISGKLALHSVGLFTHDSLIFGTLVLYWLVHNFSC
ncbi:hypothetical protein NC651_018509 [Populus alba x Populus x berolinensis]|nr:hypothetical protein NC651_018509 [Populus alba x Populus x berolinensis]